MRHLDSGRKLGISSPHRKAMMRSMALALIEKEKIRTTPAKAKELRRFAERLVTIAKTDSVHSRRRVVRLLGSTRTKTVGQNRVRLALQRLYGELAPRFKTRPGGYTRMVRIGRREGDNAELCVMEFLPADAKSSSKPKKKAAAGKKAKSAKAPEAKKAKASDQANAKSAKKAPAKSTAAKKKPAASDKSSKKS